MKSINTKLIGKILLIIGLLIVATVLICGCFLVHFLLGILAVGIVLIFFGGLLGWDNKWQ